MTISSLGGTFLILCWSLNFTFHGYFHCWTSFPRNKRKRGGNDDSQASLKAIDAFMVTNGLECKISCKSSKVLIILARILCPIAS